MFGLLVADSFLVAGTAIFMVVLGTKYLESYTVSLIGALLYLVNFAVPNLRLVGLVDAGEGFFLILLVWALAGPKLWFLPLIALMGALTKESFVPFMMVFTLVWWFASRHDRTQSWRMPAWILAAWVSGITALICLQWQVRGTYISPIQFGAALHLNREYLSHSAASLLDQNLWYIFLWLLPTSIPNLKRFPKQWLLATGAGCGMAIVLDSYFGGAPGTIGRALFSIAGPIMSLSSALLLVNRTIPGST